MIIQILKLLLFASGSVTPLAILNGHEKTITCVAVSASHGLVASGAKRNYNTQIIIVIPHTIPPSPPSFHSFLVVPLLNIIPFVPLVLSSPIRWLLPPAQYFR